MGLHSVGRIAGKRAGHVLVKGVVPQPGERVWLSREAGAQFQVPRWFEVSRTESAWVPTNMYLVGRFGDERNDYGTAPRREIVVKAGLYVERREPASQCG